MIAVCFGLQGSQPMCLWMHMFIYVCLYIVVGLGQATVLMKLITSWYNSYDLC